MLLKVLGSSSSGNCYILDNGTEALIIEAGIKFQDVKKALKFNIRKVAGCVVTHHHGDHSKYLKDMAGTFPTLALKDVFDFRDVHTHKCIEIQPLRGYQVGNFKVLPFPVNHDVPTVGYMIDHPDMGRLIFATDTCSLDTWVPDVQHVMIECNYSLKYLAEAVSEGRTYAKQLERLPKAHLSLADCKEVLKENDLSKVSEILLIHLSANNSAAEEFEKEIADATGKTVYIASPGMELELNKIY